MLLLVTTHLIALVIGGGHKGGQDSSHHDWVMTYTPTPGQPYVETVCAANHCLGTKTNPIPRAQQWLDMGESSSSGCCGMWKGACTRCVQPYTCYQYGTGQNDEWCQKASQVPGSPIAWTDNVADRPVRYLGCGWCACCQKTDPKTGLPANPAGTAPGTMRDLGSLMPKEAEEAALGDSSDDDDAVEALLDGASVVAGLFDKESVKTVVISTTQGSTSSYCLQNKFACPDGFDKKDLPSTWAVKSCEESGVSVRCWDEPARPLRGVCSPTDSRSVDVTQYATSEEECKKVPNPFELDAEASSTFNVQAQSTGMDALATYGFALLGLVAVVGGVWKTVLNKQSYAPLKDVNEL